MFEIRDSGTFIPMLAVKLSPCDEGDRYLLARAGYGSSPRDQAEYVLLCRVDGGLGTCTSSPYEWPGGARTYQVAHKYIEENFDKLASGAVICVETILGERSEPKHSEACRCGPCTQVMGYG